MMENYLQVLEESLNKKVDVLKKIGQMNEEQERLFKEDVFSEKAFDEIIDRKGMFIDDLNKLDEGFENLYEHIRLQLLDGKEKYATQIAALQKLITKVTEMGASVQAQEARNKELADNYFLNRKKELKQGRQNSKAALNYYRNMNRSQVVQPQFMDKKK